MQLLEYEKGEGLCGSNQEIQLPLETQKLVASPEPDKLAGATVMRGDWAADWASRKRTQAHSASRDFDVVA